LGSVDDNDHVVALRRRGGGLHAARNRECEKGDGDEGAVGHTNERNTYDAILQP
jgi:hypothetical protein